MASYKYDISVINSCIEKMNSLANENADELVLETQNVGSMVDQIKIVYDEVNALHKAVCDLISATAIVTNSTLRSLIELDENFVEITEEGTMISSMNVEIK